MVKASVCATRSKTPAVSTCAQCTAQKLVPRSVSAAVPSNVALEESGLAAGSANGGTECVARATSVVVAVTMMQVTVLMRNRINVEETTASVQFTLNSVTLRP
eukprot:1698468-Prymnesium_polylepis.1